MNVLCIICFITDKTIHHSRAHIYIFLSFYNCISFLNFSHSLKLSERVAYSFTEFRRLACLFMEWLIPVEDDSTWQRLSVIWFAGTELIWLLEGLSYLPSLFALYFIFRFCWTIAGISLNMENRTMMRRSWHGWKRESNDGMNTESFERKWGSHFNNVLPFAKRVRQIDSLIFFFPEVVLSDQVLRFHQ